MRPRQNLLAIVKPISLRIPRPLSGLVSRYGLQDESTGSVGRSDRPPESALLSILKCNGRPTILRTACLLILFIKSLWLQYSELVFPFRRELLRRWILIRI